MIHHSVQSTLWLICSMILLVSPVLVETSTTTRYPRSITLNRSLSLSGSYFPYRSHLWADHVGTLYYAGYIGEKGKRTQTVCNGMIAYDYDGFMKWETLIVPYNSETDTCSSPSPDECRRGYVFVLYDSIINNNHNTNSGSSRHAIAYYLTPTTLYCIELNKGQLQWNLTLPVLFTCRSQLAQMVMDNLDNITSLYISYSGSRCGVDKQSWMTCLAAIQVDKSLPSITSASITWSQCNNDPGYNHVGELAYPLIHNQRATIGIGRGNLEKNCSLHAVNLHDGSQRWCWPPPEPKIYVRSFDVTSTSVYVVFRFDHASKQQLGRLDVNTGIMLVRIVVEGRNEVPAVMSRGISISTSSMNRMEHPHIWYAWDISSVEQTRIVLDANTLTVINRIEHTGWIMLNLDSIATLMLIGNGYLTIEEADTGNRFWTYNHESSRGYYSMFTPQVILFVYHSST
jgi:hypothetical protein